MKTVIQIGLWKFCEYLFLVDNQLYPVYKPDYCEQDLSLLPENFDTSGKWFYHGIDMTNHLLPYPLESKHHKIHEMKITDTEGEKLSDFCSKQNIEKIDLLVMDIEGWEHKVIPTLDQCVPIDCLLVEYHNDDILQHLGERLPHLKEEFELFIPTNRKKFIQHLKEVGLNLIKEFETHGGDTTEMWFTKK